MNWIQNTKISGKHKWIVLFAVSCLLFNLSTISGDLIYNDAYEKAYTDTIDVTESVTAYGYFSAAYINFLSSPDYIGCGGSYSCYQIRHLELRSGNDADINCFGLFSCANIGLMECNGVKITCYAEQSCRNSTISMPSNCSLKSSSYLANADSIIYVGNSVSMNGYLSGRNSIFYSLSTDVSFNFYGIASGYNATVVCRLTYQKENRIY